MTSSGQKANRLAKETSPYLLQHANNPVDWYPWGPEALERARTCDTPILLSIGYSSCHWCHVMEHESFENHEIAALMNENFINIKVDREERPDLDHIYQNVAQLMTRSGGWPLTVFLTPDLRPYFGGTYFPPEDRYGRPGFPRILKALSDAYKNDRAAVAENAEKLTKAIASMEMLPLTPNTRPNKDDLKKVSESLLSHIDWRHGGLGSAPKFPSPMTFSYLWRWGTITQVGQPQDAVVLTLEKMARGGIYDQIGGGFHRYSVDESWSVPHFEKMLYDNGLLLKLYAEVLCTSLESTLGQGEQKLFLKVLRETVEYVLREMTDPKTGAFFSAQDADSEGREGAFFVWTKKDFTQAIGELHAELLSDWFGITDSGNFEHAGETVLWQPYLLKSFLEKHQLPEAEFDKILSAARKRLFETREARAKPFRDEKILAGWNALMISGLSWASLALRKFGEADLAETAKKAAFRAFDFLTTTLKKDETHLWATTKNGSSKITAFLDDYAFSSAAAIDVARLGRVDALDWARVWNETVWNEFLDDENGGFYFTSRQHESLITRPKTLFDQAIPSGTAVVISNSCFLAEIFSDSKLKSRTDDMTFRLFEILRKQLHGMAELANASLLWAVGPSLVSFEMSEAHPFFLTKKDQTGKPTICRNQSCQPVSDNFKFSDYLKIG